MSDQNTTPERIWIKPCDPCENPYDYYVCDPRYLDGRETSYVKSVVSCAGCGGGLKRQSGQFVCRDCGKAETVQEVLARADRAAPTDNTALVEAEKRGMQKVLSHFRECAEHDQGGLDYSSLVGIPICNADELASEVAFYERAARHVQDVLDRATLASREAPPAAQEPVAWKDRICTICDGGPGNDGSCLCGMEKWNAAPPPACQQEAVTVAEAAAVLLKARDALEDKIEKQDGGTYWMTPEETNLRLLYPTALLALKGES